MLTPRQWAHLLRLVGLWLFLFIVAGPLDAHAQLRLQQKIEAKARLFSAGMWTKSDTGAYLAGLHLKMLPGWKTYWRNPGDAGIPPMFDWSRSENVKSVQVLYPAPFRLKETTGDMVVYKDEVTFPILVAPQTPAKPVSLKLNFAYGLCKDICVPGETELSTELSAGAQPIAADAERLQTSLAEVPKRRMPNQQDQETKTPTIQSVDASLNSDAPRLKITVKFAPGSRNRDLFVEADPGIYIPMAEATVNATDTLTTFNIDLTDADDPRELKGKTLTFTAVSSHGHSETPWPIK